jgi:hypothetical protein
MDQLYLYIDEANSQYELRERAIREHKLKTENDDLQFKINRENQLNYIKNCIQDYFNNQIKIISTVDDANNPHYNKIMDLLANTYAKNSTVIINSYTRPDYVCDKEKLKTDFKCEKYNDFACRISNSIYDDMCNYILKNPLIHKISRRNHIFNGYYISLSFNKIIDKKNFKYTKIFEYIKLVFSLTDPSKLPEFNSIKIEKDSECIIL